MELSGIIVLVGVGLFCAGFLSNLGSSTKNDIKGNATSSIVLVVTYIFLIISFVGSSSEGDFFGILIGGFPIVGDALDYEQVTLAQTILEAIVIFLNCVMMIALVQIILKIRNLVLYK